MASNLVDQLADSLARTQVGERELSYLGQGLKLDNAESVKVIVKEIREFQGLRGLCLAGNTVGKEAAQAIAKALEDKHDFQCCYWSDMFTGRLRSEIPPSLTSLGGALISAGAHLKVLDLSDNAFGPDGVEGIKTLLKSSACHTLQELRLNNCGMGSGGGKILAEALKDSLKESSKLGAPLKLKIFIAGRNRLENDGATALAQAFQRMGSLEEIHMPQNGINHPGVTALAEAVAHNPELQVLNLNDNSFTKKGAISMAQALKHLRRVQVINFGDCLVRSKGALAIAGTLKGGLPNLKELDLSFGEIRHEAALAVAKAVQHKAQLEKLDLSGNHLGQAGCENLRELMKSMNKGHLLASLSDDEGEEDDDDDDYGSEEDDDDDDDDDEEAEEEEDSEEDSEEDEPSAPKQVDVTDMHMTVEAVLNISSTYKEGDPEAKTAVLERVDAVLSKAFSNPSVQTISFISALLVKLGLLKSEDKCKPVPVVPGHLQCLEHVVKQTYFPQEHIVVLLAFLDRRQVKSMDSCFSARDHLLSTLRGLLPKS